MSKMLMENCRKEQKKLDLDWLNKRFWLFTLRMDFKSSNHFKYIPSYNYTPKIQYGKIVF